jgi:ABC-type sugar transport system permease subunit
MTFTSIVASVMAGLVVNSARADFGKSWNLVLALDVINTVVVVLYLWRILREKSGPGQPKRRGL